MNLTKTLVLSALVAASSMSFAQNSHPTPAHKSQGTQAAQAASKPMHAKPHHQPSAKHHAKTDKPHAANATKKGHHEGASAPTK